MVNVSEYFIWDINPILVKLGPVSIHWYGLFFATAIISGYQIMSWIFKREQVDKELLDSLLMYIVCGTIIGARLVHCFVYDPSYYLADPIRILKVWEGGLASHGGVLGIIVACILFCRKHKELDFVWLLDRLAVVAVIGGALIRCGNFFNSEIIGKASTLPWAVVFKRVDLIPRHPSQMYEALAYIIIFLVLLFVYLKTSLKDTPGALLGLMLALVFSMRFILEFLKVRQAEYGESLEISVGQWLSVPYILFGLYLILRAKLKMGKSLNSLK